MDEMRPADYAAINNGGMGRFSRDGGQSGYSRHETGGLKKKLEELREQSPEEYDRLISQLEG